MFTKEDILYIKKYFISTQSLCEELNIKIDLLGNLINKKMFPLATYAIKNDKVIWTALDEKKFKYLEEGFFNKSVINFYKKYPLSYDCNFDIVKNSFIVELESELNKFELKYSSTEIKELFNEVMNGVYGGCLKILEPKFIVKKLYSIHMLDKLYESGKDKVLPYMKLYDETCLEFPPSVRESTSRNKYIDTLVKKYNMDYKIYDYKDIL